MNRVGNNQAMFMLLLYMTLVTLTVYAFPAWTTATTLLAPAAVVLILRLVLALTGRQNHTHKKAPGDTSTGGQG